MPWNETVFSEKPVKWGRLAIYTVLWGLWAFIPLLVLWKLMPSQSPDGLLWLTETWRVLVFLWTLSLVVLCFWLLASMDGKGATVTQCALGILCSLSLGLPSILLGAVPFLAFNMKSLQQLFPYGNVVKLRGAAEAKNRTPNVYIVGIDVSNSFLPPQEVAESRPASDQPHTETRLDTIHNTILQLFDPEKGVIGRTLQPDDILIIWTFAGEPFESAWARSDQTGNDIRKILKRIEKGELATDIRHTRGAQKPHETDILQFFKIAVYPHLKPEKYHRMKVILFSDLQHVRMLKPGERDTEVTNELDRGIRELATTLKASNNEEAEQRYLAVLAFTPSVTHDGWPIRESGVVRDLRKQIDGRLRPSIWQTYDLTRFGTLKDVEKRVHLASLYENVIDAETMYLKYDASRDNEPLESYLLVNEKTSEITLGLRKRPAVEFLDPDRTNMRITAGTGKKSCSLELVGAQPSAQVVGIDRDHGSNVPVVLEPGYTLGHSQSELLVETSPKTVYRIPVNILTMDQVQVQAINAIGKVLFALNFVPLFLAAHSVRFKHRLYFKRRRPKGEVSESPASPAPGAAPPTEE